MRNLAIGLLFGALSFVGVVVIGCGSDDARVAIDEDPTGADGGVGFGRGNGDGGGPSGPCVGLQCAQVQCSGGTETTVTGKVFAPNGKLPLYNAIVYVPNQKPDAMVRGATCDKCGAVTGSPVVTALTDPTGSFTLRNVPVGKDVPLVIQIGKWRRQVTIPEVTACAETKLTDPEMTRLPKKQSEGDMPQIALTSGQCDNLGCMLPKVGIDPSEFGTEIDGPSKAVHIYIGGGGEGPDSAAFAPALWNSAATLRKYDMIILSCECEEHLENKSPLAFAAMTSYLEAGGRIFTTDFMYTWYKFSPDVGFNSIGNIRGGAPSAENPMTIDQSFPKGKALADWLASAANVSGGTVAADAMFSNFMSLQPTKAQQWATSAPGDNAGVGPRVVTVNLPVGQPAEAQCGKAVHIDAHVNHMGEDIVDYRYPAGCPTPLKDAESLLAFFFFDLASCIQNDAEVPKPPVVK